MFLDAGGGGERGSTPPGVLCFLVKQLPASPPAASAEAAEAQGLIQYNRVAAPAPGDSRPEHGHWGLACVLGRPDSSLVRFLEPSPAQHALYRVCLMLVKWGHRFGESGVTGVVQHVKGRLWAEGR